MDPVAGAGGPGSRFKGKHSLDSDEEDDDDEGSSKYDILASEDVEGELNPRIVAAGGTDGVSRDMGWRRLLSVFACSAWATCVFGAGQEAATLPSEGGVRITPFNLQEEMEEGHFDADGNYFLNRDAQIRDSWLDNIDWVWPRG